jgi:glycolate oxidase FAD binding subunit
MATAEVSSSAPRSAAELAGELAGATEAGRRVRLRGAGTKLRWAPDARPDIEISTAGLDQIVEHNAGDLTAVLEAGVPLARAQEAFREAGQMLALDPPDRGGATIGGVVAANDSGPLRTRFGSARDLVVGMRVALSDGIVAKSGGKVIKNVAGYDLAKLFTGSYGSLGAIVEVSVRLHPLPPETVTAVGHTRSPGVLARGAAALSHARQEQLGLDVRWGAGAGMVLARFGGVAARPQAVAAERLLHEAGLEAELATDEWSLWDAQRDGQRSPEGLVARVSALQTDLAEVAALAERHGATLVGRGGLGLSWLRLDDPGGAQPLLDELRGSYVTTVLDRPATMAATAADPADAGTALLQRRVKERFDPAGTLV